MEFFKLSKGLALGALIVASTSGLASSKEIPVIGVDDNGNEIVVTESVSSFRGKLAQAHEIVSRSSLGALERATRNGNDLQLKGLEVGVGIFGEIGLGDVIKASAEPTLIFVYSRNRQSGRTQ